MMFIFYFVSPPQHNIKFQSKLLIISTLNSTKDCIYCCVYVISLDNNAGTPLLIVNKYLC